MVNQISLSGGKTTDVSLPVIRTRLLNYEPIVQLKDLAANTFGNKLHLFISSHYCANHSKVL